MNNDNPIKSKSESKLDSNIDSTQDNNLLLDTQNSSMQVRKEKANSNNNSHIAMVWKKFLKHKKLIASAIKSILLCFVLIVPWLQPIAYTLYWDVDMTPYNEHMYRLLAQTGLYLCIPAHIIAMVLIRHSLVKSGRGNDVFTYCFLYVLYIAFIVYVVLFFTVPDIWR